MENQSPFLRMQQVERLLKGMLRAIDVDVLDQGEKKALAGMQRLAVEARLDIRDYQLSETREEQLGKAADAKKSLNKLRASLLAAANAFSPADIAQLDAQIEQIRSGLI